MVPSIILLLSRSFGIRKSVSQTVGKTFKNTKHHIATQGGTSKLTFGYSNNKPIFGSWQGATKSVINWVLMSSSLQRIHQNHIKGATFQSTDKKITVLQSIVGFVDDNNNCVTGEEGTSITDALQESAQKWERLLFASGGTLEITK